MAAFNLSQRDLEGILEDLDPIYRHIEDVEEIDELRDYATLLRGVARRLEYLASDYDTAADEAEQEADGYCPDCGCSDILCPDCGLCLYCGTCHCDDELEDGE